MIDFNKPNTHIKFIDDISQIKGPVNYSTNHTKYEIDEQIQQSDLKNDFAVSDHFPKVNVSREKKSEYIHDIRMAQSENKKQYKKLADALVKEEQLRRVSEALTLDKMLK